MSLLLSSFGRLMTSLRFLVFACHLLLVTCHLLTVIDCLSFIGWLGSCGIVISNQIRSSIQKKQHQNLIQLLDLKSQTPSSSFSGSLECGVDYCLTCFHFSGCFVLFSVILVACVFGDLIYKGEYSDWSLFG